MPVTIAQYVDLRGQLDRALLRQASIDASEEFGSGFLCIVERDGEPRQYIDPTIPDRDDIGYLDLRAEGDPEAAALEWMRAEYSRPLNMVTDRLIRLAVLQLSDDHWYFYLRAHHIVLDGFSAMNYLGRLAEHYTAAVNGTRAARLKVSDLRSLVESEFEYRESTRFQSDREHWAQRVAGLESGTSLVGGTAPPAPLNGLASEVLSDDRKALLAAVRGPPRFHAGGAC